MPTNIITFCLYFLEIFNNDKSIQVRDLTYGTTLKY